MSLQGTVSSTTKKAQLLEETEQALEAAVDGWMDGWQAFKREGGNLKTF